MDTQEFVNRFSYHAPAGNQAERYQEIQGMGADFARLIDELCPESRELALAFTKIEEAIFWANAAIARRENPVG